LRFLLEVAAEEDEDEDELLVAAFADGVEADDELLAADFVEAFAVALSAEITS